MVPAARNNEYVNVTVHNRIVVIRINRPQKLNAFNQEMRLALSETIRTYGTGQDADGIVVTATGRAFSAGKDLSEGFGESFHDSLDEFNDMTRAILETKVPTVAAINGIAVGGVAEFTLCFDSRLGSSAAEYMFPENKIGLPISNASSFLLPRLVGVRNAHRLLLESPRIGADEALEIGLLDEVVAPERLIDRAVERALAWANPSQSAGSILELLRPPAPALKAAIDNESRVAAAIWEGKETTQI